MELRRVGKSGLRVSAIGLGTLTWGRDTDEHEAKDQLREFVDAGGTLIDTAATYCDGSAEEIIGSLLQTEVARSEVVLCSKSGVKDGRVNASRGALLETLDETLARLDTDHLDLWMVQSPDPNVRLEETVWTLCHALNTGRCRYVGLSNFPAWQVARAATLLEGAGVELTAVETEYSLLERGSEAELRSATTALGIGTIAWSPLGRGVLTGKYRRSIPADSRAASPHLRGFVEPYLNDSARAVVEAVATAADGLGRSPLEVALAWVRDSYGVSSVLAGARTPAQLRGVLQAEDLELPDQIRAVLDEVTEPRISHR